MLLVAFCISLTGCGDSAEPMPTATSVKAQDVEASFTPVSALTKVTATPVGGGTAYVAILSTPGIYRFTALPVGNYMLQYVPAAGYAAPAPQPLTVQASIIPGVPEVIVLTERAALLTAVKWKATANTTLNKTKGTTTDNLAALPACQLDNFFQFQANNSLNLDEGPSKCAPADAQVIKYTWALEKNETQLRFLQGGGSSLGDVVQLTATAMQLRNTYFLDNQELVQTITYAAF
jgi:hypothetical protein